jgi:hypothetical protein
MTGEIKIEERLEQMSRRLERAEQANRAMKIWGSIAIAVLVAAGPFASSVMAKAKPKAKVVTASAFNLESGGNTVASLEVVGGQPTLIFLDPIGKPVIGIGINSTSLPTGHAAGVEVFDGNADIPGGTGVVRADFGVTPSGTSAGEGIGTFDSTGNQRSFVGSAPDGSLAGGYFYDATGTIRTGVQYDPAINFNGVFSDSETGVNLFSAGSVIAATSSLQEDESFMDLSDTSATLRLIDFQNTTNEGGLVYNPGSTTVDGDWGNP